MKKNIKRLVAVLVVMAMIISLCSTAFAAPRTSKKSSRGHHKGWTTEASVEQTEAPVVEDTTETPTEDQATVETTEPAPEETVVEETASEVVEEAAEETVSEDLMQDEEMLNTETSSSEEFVFEELVGTERIKVTAPAGAFEPGTEMKVKNVNNEESLAKVAASLDESKIYSLFALDISFWYEGSEVEPKYPVDVTWESANIDSNECQLIHLSDTGKVNPVKDAEISSTEAVFTADSFSEYVLVSTTRQSTVPIEHFTFNPSSISPDVTEITSGDIAENAPVIDGYTFKNATVQLSDGTDVAVQVGAFIAKYEDGENPGDTKEEYHVYYRTEESMSSSDIIVLLADDTITLNYEQTPNRVTYRVVYNGTTYTVGTDELPADLADLVYNGPSSVPAAGEEQAVNVTIPRGFQGNVRIVGSSTTTASLGVEPEYTIVSGSNNKTIGRTSSSVEALDLDGIYDLPAGSVNITVTLTLTKRSSYTFNARHFLGTVYTGGNGYNNWGDTAITGYRQNYARLTTDSAYSLNSNTAANRGTRSFTEDGTIWAFTTVREASDDISDPNDVWMLDALEINETTIELPYNQGESKSTTLPSGTIVTVTLDSVTHSANTGTGYRRHYILSVSNCYENIVITGGNIVNAASSTEIIPEVLENVTYAFYGYSTADRAYSGTGLGWQTWGVGEPISVGTRQSVSGSRNYNMYGFNQTNNNAMRFSVADGYEDPEIAFVSTSGTDLISNIDGPRHESKNSDGYYPITSNPTNGYYYFRVTGLSNEHVANLRIRASLIRYGVTYNAGSVNGATVPDDDNGGTYGDGSIRGYNVEDNDIVVLDKSIPSDPNNEYVFTYYTIGNGTTHYAPGQKIDLSDLMDYAGSTKNSDGLYEIPVTAHWVAKEQAETVTIKVNFDLDDEFERSVDVQVTKGSSVYIDIDSEEMTKFMNDYNWQLFYDEVGSNPYIEAANKDQEVDLHIYSKFYVYHSATNTLELHTTKEMETGEGNNRTIGKLDLTALTTEGYYYGGYYKDYLGAHEGNTASGTNLVKAAADANNSDGTLTTADIVKLSNKGSVVIPEYEYTEGTQYDPVNNEAHLAYWTRANAFTTVMKNSDTSWFGDRGANDTKVLKTGGTGTNVTIARAGIYYLHEVPADYLATPKVATIKDNYGSGDITKMFLLSVADLNIFRAGGVKVKTTDTKGSFAKNFTLTKYDDGTDSVVSTETKTAKQLFDAYGYLTVTDGKSCLADGQYKLDPYWITYDNVTIHGSDVEEAGHVRTITVSGNTVE